jgi:predicted RNA polymerase sigma factor
VVDLNRAVALAMLFGPAAGLELIDKLTLPALKAYHLLPSVRGDLLQARPAGRSPRRVRARCPTHQERARAQTAARPRC